MTTADDDDHSIAKCRCSVVYWLEPGLTEWGPWTVAWMIRSSTKTNSGEAGIDNGEAGINSDEAGIDNGEARQRWSGNKHRWSGNKQRWSGNKQCEIHEHISDQCISMTFCKEINLKTSKDINNKSEVWKDNEKFEWRVANRWVK